MQNIFYDLVKCILILFISVSYLYAQDGEVIAHWDFNEGAGDSAYDISGNNNHFKLYNGIKWVDGINGKALSFDGIDDKGLCESKPSQSGFSAFSIEAVIMIDKYPEDGDYVVILNKWGQGSVEDDAWGFCINNTAPFNDQMSVITPNGWNRIRGSKPLPLKEWIHYVFTWDGKTMYTYKNGVKADSATAPYSGCMRQVDVPITLGAYEGNRQYLCGKIDEMLLYNYALTAQNVKFRYTSLFNRNKHIIADWNNMFIIPVCNNMFITVK